MPAKILMLRNQLAAAEAALNTLMQTRSTLQTRDAELEARLAAADAEDPDLQREIEENDTATTENETAITEAESKVEGLRSQIQELETRAAGAIGAPTVVRSRSDAQTRAAQFQRTGRQTIDNVATFLRATPVPLTVSGGTVATPTVVNGISGPVGPQVGTFIDLIEPVDATGCGTWREAYDKGTDGVATTAEGGTVPEYDFDDDFGYVDFQPLPFPVDANISEQVMYQSPLAYETAVHEKVRLAMRKGLSAAAVTNIVNSPLSQQLEVVTSGIDHNFLSDLLLSYGGEEGVEGEGVLVLCKTDLRAFAKVRGKNEYIPTYSVIQDTVNSNTGIIRDNYGLSCRYVLDKNVKPLTGAAEGDLTMFYGNPKCAKLLTWGGCRVRVFEGPKISKRLLTIAGDMTANVGPRVPNGFIVVKAKAAG